MVIVSALPVLVEQLAAHPALLPSVDELRPASCPCCGEPSRPPGGRLRIVGHGTYGRQVLGLGALRQVTIRVRRFLCRGCKHTISVLPDELYPGRLYAGVPILLSLWLTLARGRPAREARTRFGSPGETEGWKTVRRWRCALLHRLWPGLAASSRGAAPTRAKGRRRLRQLLGDAGLSLRCGEDQVAAAARELTRRHSLVHEPTGEREHELLE